MLLALAFSALAVAGPMSAQAPAAPPRPDYRVTRFDENWAVLRGTGTPEKLDILKYRPLSPSGSVYVSLGGQVRGRSESVRNFGLSPAPTNQDTFELLRVMLHADLHAGSHLRVFVEGKQAMAFSRDLPGGKRPLDQDEWDLQNAFVEAGVAGVNARFGRQELLVGSQRLVSPLDWTNTRRTFDGLRLIGRVSALTLDGFVTRPVTVVNTIRNTRDPATLFWGVTVRPSVAAARFAWELYVLGLNQEETTKLWDYTGAHERYTLGGRATGALGSPTLRYEVEGGWQTGTLAGHDIAAWFVASDLTRSFPTAKLKPAVAVGLDYASGDSDPTDDVVGTFHQLYPLGHAYAGYMDLLGRQNMIEMRTVLTIVPAPAINGRVSLHHFMRVETTDAAYGVAGAITRKSPGVERSIGSELDVTAGYRANRHTRFDVGYGHFRPGGLLLGSAAGAVSSDWGFVATTFTF